METSSQTPQVTSDKEPSVSAIANTSAEHEFFAPKPQPEANAQTIFEADKSEAHGKRKRKALVLSKRHPLVSVLVIGASLYLMWYLRSDFLFYFQPRTAPDLGDASAALVSGQLHAGDYVTVHGAPDRKHALIVQARMGGFESIFRLHETKNKFFVQQHRDTRNTDKLINEIHTGQLVRFSSLSYAQGLREHFNKSMTNAHDFDFSTLREAKNKNKIQINDHKGEPVKLSGESVFWINASFANEWLAQFSKQYYAQAQDAAKTLDSLSVPYILEEDDSKLFWRFVVHTTTDNAAKLVEHFRDPALHVGLSNRQISFNARWDQMSIEGDNLLLNVKDETAASRYVIGEGNKLIPNTQTPIRLAASNVLYLTTSTPFVVDSDALVLISDKHPADQWTYLALYLLLGGFIVLNSVLIVGRLNQSRNHEEEA